MLHRHRTYDSNRLIKFRSHLDSVDHDYRSRECHDRIPRRKCVGHFPGSGEHASNRRNSHGYFIQFICREIYDVLLQELNVGITTPSPVPMAGIIRKLDKNFFAGRWAKATDRQRDLLSVIAMLDNCDEEFTVQDIVIQAKTIANPFSSSLVNQMLSTLTDAGLIYKNRHGKYSFAVPLLGQFILRQDIELNAP